ncbi:MAG: DUF697 domain-containing protein [Anaerolineae bacterium]|nr:DUF697 domain-containing protein [Anaerolineae bacterium]
MLDTMLTEARDAWDGLRWGWNDPGSYEPERAQVALVGLRGVGKKTIFNSLVGWQAITGDAAADDQPLKRRDYGLFSLLDLPVEADQIDEALFQLEDADLLVYVLDGRTLLGSDDFRWIARLRARRAPLLVVLNKADLLGEHLAVAKAEIEQQITMNVLPLCAHDRADVQGRLVTEMLRLCPKLTVPLASQIKGIRREAAQRLIRQSTAISLIASVEPLPLLDISVLIGLQIHLLSRIGALYGQSMSGQSHWAIVSTVAFGLGLRYLAETLLKFVPYGGWLLSGLIGASGTWAVGQAALAFYESNNAQQDWSRQLAARLSHVIHRRTH